MILLVSILFICLQAFFRDVLIMFSFFLSITAQGPDAVQFIVNHANVQAIFCVAETLNSVSPSI